MEARDAQRREQSQVTKSKASRVFTTDDFRRARKLKKKTTKLKIQQKDMKLCVYIYIYTYMSLWIPQTPELFLKRCSILMRQWMRCVKQSAWHRSGRRGQNRLRQRKKKSRRTSCRNTDMVVKSKSRQFLDSWFIFFMFFYDLLMIAIYDFFMIFHPHKKNIKKSKKIIFVRIPLRIQCKWRMLWFFYEFKEIPWNS